jgi:hypothetical protein
MLRTVRDACTLQPEALAIRISDQIEQLDQIIASEDDGRSFFEKTHITQGMETLIREGIARLAGKPSSPIFHLKQAMGGGKTHLLVGLGLLARHETLRPVICPTVPYIDAFGAAKIAAFNGRNSPVEFFWGEIAKQLGKSDQFAAFWKSGPIAPDEQDWQKLFDGGEPILILLDEMPPYFHYLDTQPVGNGTVADIATRAFANMLTAAGKENNVCVVISDLAAEYETGRRLINKALRDAADELGRQEQPITPVDLTGNEVYEILRKRLFKSLPSQAVIDDIASHYGQALGEATKAKVTSQSAESMTDEIAQTYPFHPRLKNLIALFKENEKFKQTRGLMEIVSRLLKSVWERQDNDVYLIGAQHFDLSIADVREKLGEVSEMGDVIAKDLWDASLSAHAQIIDLSANGDTASHVGALLLTASLSTAVNAVKGLTKEEIVECLVAPNRAPSDFREAFDQLESKAWYLHHTPEGRYYFDRQENLTKLLRDLAEKAPENKIAALIEHHLVELYKPTRKSAYDEVLALPKLEEVADKVRRSRVLLIVSPDSKLPPEEVQRFFDALSQKNNLCVLTGDKTRMASIEKAARQRFAALHAESRIAKGHPQRDELEQKQQQYAQDFTATVHSVFDKVMFPIQRREQPPQLAHKVLDQTRDQNKPFDGEEQIEKTLVSDPRKLYTDVDKEFDALRDKAEELLWAAGQDDARWSDIVDRVAEQSAMPWLQPKGIEILKTSACNRGLWEDLGNGYITKKPQKKRTSVQVVTEGDSNDAGSVRLRVNPQNAGPAPHIHYAEDGVATPASPLLKDQYLTTNALRVTFLAVDPSEQFETGDPYTWKNTLTIRNELAETGEQRQVQLMVAPMGEIRYSLDGSEPRNGIPYTKPFDIGNNDTTVLVFAECDGLEAREQFTFPAAGNNEVVIHDTKAAYLGALKGVKRLDSRQKTYEALKQAAEKSIEFDSVTITIGDGSSVVSLTIDMKVGAGYVQGLLDHAVGVFQPDVPITMAFKKAYFKSGHDLKQFAETVGMEINVGEVQQ